MFLSTLQPSATYATTHDHGISIEKTAIETELSYLSNFDATSISVDVIGDFIVVEGVVKSSSDLGRVLRVAHEIAGYHRVLSRVVVCNIA